MRPDRTAAGILHKRIQSLHVRTRDSRNGGRKLPRHGRTQALANKHRQNEPGRFLRAAHTNDCSSGTSEPEPRRTSLEKRTRAARHTTCTNELRRCTSEPRVPRDRPRATSAELPDHRPVGLALLGQRHHLDRRQDQRARLDRLLDGPGPTSEADWDLVAAIRATKLPGAAPYPGPIDRELLARAPDGLGFDAAGLAWLASFRQPPDVGVAG